MEISALRNRSKNYITFNNIACVEHWRQGVQAAEPNWRFWYFDHAFSAGALGIISRLLPLLFEFCFWKFLQAETNKRHQSFFCHFLWWRVPQVATGNLNYFFMNFFVPYDIFILDSLFKKLPKSKVDLWCRLVSYLFNTSSAMMSCGTWRDRAVVPAR